MPHNSFLSWVYLTYLAGNNLLQSILTFDVGVVSHDDHDDGHEFIHQGQRTMF